MKARFIIIGNKCYQFFLFEVVGSLPFLGNTCQMSSLNNHSLVCSYFQVQKQPASAHKSSNHTSVFTPITVTSVCNRSVFMHTSYFVIQNIKVMCTQRLRFTKTVFTSSSRTFLSENLFHFLNWECLPGLFGASALFWAKGPAVLLIIASVPSVQILQQWKRQIMSWTIKNSFDIRDPLISGAGRGPWTALWKLL